MDVLDGLDEVALAEDDIAVFGDFESNRLEFHHVSIY
jgi:hypothetical protein